MQKQLFLGVMPSPEKIQPIVNYMQKKAKGGLWTSTYTEEGKSDWINWCEQEDFWKEGHKDKWTLTVSENAKVLKVDNINDLNEVYGKYGYKTYEGLDILSLDFEKISVDYDGLWLTERGQWETRFSMPFDLYGWDCESAHWFRWVFEKVEYAGKLQIEV